jgi:hypothetical protein
MSLNRNAVHESILRHAPGISGAHHRAILDGLQADGLIDASGVVRAVAEGKRSTHMLTPRAACAAAADLNTSNSLKSIQKRCQRAGFDFSLSDDEPLELHKIDRAFKAAGTADISERLAIKSTLHRLGLLA